MTWTNIVQLLSVEHLCPRILPSEALGIVKSHENNEFRECEPYQYLFALPCFAIYLSLIIAGHKINL